KASSPVTKSDKKREPSTATSPQDQLCKLRRPAFIFFDGKVCPLGYECGNARYVYTNLKNQYPQNFKNQPISPSTLSSLTFVDRCGRKSSFFTGGSPQTVLSNAKSKLDKEIERYKRALELRQRAGSTEERTEEAKREAQESKKDQSDDIRRQDDY